MEFYIKPLTNLINLSIKQGIFPDELKIARVVPIFKSGDKALVSNYCPISVLSFVSKIYEKIMYNYLIDFINDHNILYKYQFGFRKQYSTNHAIISLVEKINSALYNGNFMIGVYLDLKKAFDTVDHKILIRKLHAYGIIGNILNWFKSYLHNRKQYVYINKTKSKTKVINCGIPQGSILGPILFIYYINDLSESSKRLFPILFADDTSVFIEGTNLDETIELLNEELNKITTWLSANKLTVNVVKSHYMIFHRSRIKYTTITNILLGPIALKQVNYTKFLGVIIDDKLNFTNHIAYIKNKVSKGMGIILKASKNI